MIDFIIPLKLSTTEYTEDTEERTYLI